MGFLDAFKQKTPAEQLRENKRMLDRAIRDLDRERQRIEAQEKKTVLEMKKAAKAGQKEACRMMAKDIVRQRAQVTKFYKMRAQLSSVSMQMQSLKSQQAMNRAMAGVTRTMAVMNSQMNLPAIQALMSEFERQSGMNEMKQEMIDDVMDDVLAGDEEEEETEELVDRVMTEIGVSFGEELGTAPVGKGRTVSPSADSVEDVADGDLQARLDSLRRL